MNVLVFYPDLFAFPSLEYMALENEIRIRLLIRKGIDQTFSRATSCTGQVCRHAVLMVLINVI